MTLAGTQVPTMTLVRLRDFEPRVHATVPPPICTAGEWTRGRA